MAPDPRVTMAACNNADLYAAMFAAAGRRYQRLPYAFIALDAPLPYYSDVTVTGEGHKADVIRHLGHLAQMRGGSIGLKDSFCEHDLHAHGFATLFDATWIWHPGTQIPPPKGWVGVTDPEGLANWQEAWKAAGSPTPQTVFDDALLQDPAIAILARLENGVVVAGCIANRSDDCVGLSNLFGAAALSGLYSSALSAVAAFAPDLPIVGYESGESLTAALGAGCQGIGALRILVADHPRF
jgi:hypothetical protein